jgi:NAD-dependent DNA ligase
VNDELISQSITDLFRLDYKTIFNLKHKNKLQKLKSKLESQNLDNKKIQKLIKSLEKSKEKYLNQAKLDITKKEIEYLCEEIKKILENLK